MKIALNMIVYDETDALDRCLASCKPYVDGIYVLQTSTSKATSKILDTYDAVYKVDTTCHHTPTKKEITWLKHFFGWQPRLTTKDTIFLFDKARNLALDIVPNDFDYIMWIDADDVLRNGQYIPEALDLMERNGATALFMNYIYEASFNKDGTIKDILIEHLRERIIKHKSGYTWVAPIHETLISQSGEARQIETKKMDILHLKKTDTRHVALTRNEKALEHNIYMNKGEDPRTCYYLAKCYYDEHTPEAYQKSKFLIFTYLNGKHPSGWSEERSQACEYLSEIYREEGVYNKAVKAAVNGLIENPKFPSLYLSLAKTYLWMKDFEKADYWLQLALKTKMPTTTLVMEPKQLMSRTLEVMFSVKMNAAKLDEAWAAIMKLYEMHPDHEDIKQQAQLLTELREQRDLTRHFVELAKQVEKDEDKDAIQALLRAAPRSIRDNPIVSEFIKKYKPPVEWPRKSVVIYVGAGFTPWNPNDLTLKRNNFVGGSEEAVIYASRELVRQGYSVTVYGDPGQEGVFDGVEYKYYFKFNPEDTFDIFMVWRNPQAFDWSYKARKTYLWLHDVPNIHDFSQKRIDNITKIFVLSKAHRSLLPDVPDDKFFITSNGYSEELPNITNNNKPYQCIWTSSYDRGLQHLLEIWPEVKKAVPEATLRIFYGWQLFDKFYANNPERQMWKGRIEELMKADGIYHGGRLTQIELEKEYKEAGFWTYPTDFFEINCISAIKAQAFGAVPVVIDYAALSETVRFGEKVVGSIWDAKVKKAYTQTLIKAFKEKWDRKGMSTWAKGKYTWENIVTSWTKEYERNI